MKKYEMVEIEIIYLNGDFVRTSGDDVADDPFEL